MATAKRKRKSSPKRPSPERMAEILSIVDIEPPNKIADKYGVSERTIWRWKAAMAKGELPDVARLVSKLKSAAAQACKDLLTSTFDASLRRIGAQLPRASISEAIKAAEMCGDLLITRKVLNVEGDPEGETAPGNEGLVGRPTGSAEERQPVH